MLFRVWVSDGVVYGFAVSEVDGGGADVGFCLFLPVFREEPFAFLVFGAEFVFDGVVVAYELPL